MAAALSDAYVQLLCCILGPRHRGRYAAIARDAAEAALADTAGSLEEVGGSDAVRRWLRWYSEEVVKPWIEVVGRRVRELKADAGNSALWQAFDEAIAQRLASEDRGGVVDVEVERRWRRKGRTAAAVQPDGFYRALGFWGPLVRLLDRDIRRALSVEFPQSVVNEEREEEPNSIPRVIDGLMWELLSGNVDARRLRILTAMDLPEEEGAAAEAFADLLVYRPELLVHWVVASTAAIMNRMLNDCALADPYSEHRYDSSLDEARKMPARGTPPPDVKVELIDTNAALRELPRAEEEGARIKIEGWWTGETMEEICDRRGRGYESTDRSARRGLNHIRTARRKRER